MKNSVVQTKVKINPNIIFTENDASIVTLEVATN